MVHILLENIDRVNVKVEKINIEIFLQFTIIWLNKNKK